MKAEKVIKGGTYWVRDCKGDLVSAKWDGKKWMLIGGPESKNKECNDKNKQEDYSYTVKSGDESITLTFKTYTELLEFYISINQKTQPTYPT